MRDLVRLQLYAVISGTKKKYIYIYIYAMYICIIYRKHFFLVLCKRQRDVTEATLPRFDMACCNLATFTIVCGDKWYQEEVYIYIYIYAIYMYHISKTLLLGAVYSCRTI
jgi:hypothetical protein